MDAIETLGDQATTPNLSKRLKVGVFTLRKLLKSMAKDGRVHLAGTGPRDFHWVAGAKKAAPSKAAPAAPSRKSSEVGEVVWNGVSGRHVSLTSR